MKSRVIFDEVEIDPGIKTVMKGVEVFRSEECNGVIVVGGGNTAAITALYLTEYASEVILVHRRSSLRAENALITALNDNKKIKMYVERENQGQ